jgi:fibronectin type 3 domain-containing protein
VRRHIVVLVLFVTALIGATASPAGAAAAPLPPSGLTATAVSANEVLLTWDPVDGATGYEIYWGDAFYSEYVASTSQTSYRHTPLAPGTTYGYAVRTVTRKGTSQLSAFVQVTTPPEAPTLLQAEVIKADQVRLSWQPGSGALSYAITEVAADGTERPATVLEMEPRTAVVQTVAETHYVLRVRGVNGTLLSLDYATVEITTPPREPSVIEHDSPSPVPAGDSVLTFSVVGMLTFQPTYGTLDVSIDGGPVATAPVDQKAATLAVTLAPGTHSMSADYSGDGAFLPAHADFTFYVAVPAPTFVVDAVDPSAVPAAAAADVTCDGDTDLISLSPTPDGSGSSLDVRAGRPDGTLGPVRSTVLPELAGYLAAGDLNRDGCADVAVLGTDLLIFTGSPSGPVAGSRVRAGGLMSGLSLHDITHDGLLDAVVNHPDGVVVLPGTGRGGFGRARTMVPEQARYAVGDLDGDGLLDIVTATGDGVHGWMQSGTGQFARRWTSNLLALTLAVDDLTGDGRAEVVVGESGITVLSGQDGRPQSTVPGVISQPTVLATGDVDGDGLRDIVSMDGFWSIAMSLSYAGAPTAMQYRRIDPHGIAPRDLLLADLSRDGRTDIVLLDYAEGLLIARQS